MAIVFPASPSVNETFTAGSITYKWDGDKWIGLGVTPADRLIEGSNKLEIDGSNNLVWTGNNVGIGLTIPGSKLHVEGLSSLSTTLDVGGISLSDAATITYPTTSSFRVTAGTSVNIELGTSQTVNTSTPGGFNFVTADNRTYTKSAGTTSDIERLYFAGFDQSFNWTDANTCKQYVGITDNFNYSGINANGRTSSYFGATSISLSPPDGGTQTISNVGGKEINLRSQGTSTININNSCNIGPVLNLWNFVAGTKTVNITNHAFFETSQWGVYGATGTVNATITNLYGLRLRPPFSSTGLTITNNWGIYQEWGNANNYFAGNIQMASGKGIDFSATANAAGMTSELLDDYEEGTWTPRIGTDASHSITHVSQVGRYTKIGNTVFIECYVSWSSFTGSGNVYLTDLPFILRTSSSAGSTAFSVNASATTGIKNYQFRMDSSNANTSTVYLYNFENTSLTSIATVGTNSHVVIRGHYYVS